jgi:GxxExxY protein
MPGRVYREALEIERVERGIPSQSQASLPIVYKGHLLENHYFADLLVYNKIIAELKARDQLSSAPEAQVFNYPKAGQQPVGVLLNFGARSLQWKRFVFTACPT